IGPVGVPASSSSVYLTPCSIITPLYAKRANTSATASASSPFTVRETSSQFILHHCSFSSYHRAHSLIIVCSERHPPAGRLAGAQAENNRTQTLHLWGEIHRQRSCTNRTCLHGQASRF